MASAISEFDKEKIGTFDTTISGTTVSGTLSEFTVPIRINSTTWPTSAERDNFFGSWNVSGMMCQFFDPNRYKELSFEVEYFDAPSETALYHLKPLEIKGDVVASGFILAYMNSGGTSPNPIQVDNKNGSWDEHCRMVQHLGDNSFSGSTAIDSTASGMDLTDNGTADIAGIARRGREFDVYTDNLITSAPIRYETNGFTLEMFLNFDAMGSDDMYLFFADAGGATETYSFRVLNSDNKLIFFLRDSDNNTIFRKSNAVLSAGITYHVAAVFERNLRTCHIYINGALDEDTVTSSLTTQTTAVVNPLGNVKISNTPTSVEGRGIDGWVDEIRISDTPRTQHWLNLTNYSFRNDDWIEWGAEQTPTEGGDPFLKDEYWDDYNIQSRDSNLAIKIKEPTSRTLTLSPRGSGFPDKYRVSYNAPIREADGKFRLWVNGSDNQETLPGGLGYRAVLYFESDDGEIWTAPDLKADGDYLGRTRTEDMTFNSSANNNIVWLPTAESPKGLNRLYVTRDDDEADSDKRYKIMIGGLLVSHSAQNYFSADGINWTFGPDNPQYINGERPDPSPEGTGEDFTTIAKNELTGEWEAYNQLTQSPDDGKRYWGAAISKDDFDTFQVIDDIPNDFDGHSHGGLFIYRNGVRIWFTEDWQFIPVNNRTVIGVKVKSSRTMHNLNYIEDLYILPLGDPGDGDEGFILAPGGLTFKNETKEHWLYYGGMPVDQTDVGWPTTIGKVFIAKWPVDGFTQLELTSGTTATLVTEPIGDTLRGDKSLWLNYTAGGGENIKAELLALDGTPLTNYTLADADALTGEDFDAEVTWNGSPLINLTQNFKIKFYFTGAGVQLRSRNFKDSGTVEQSKDVIFDYQGIVGSGKALIDGFQSPLTESILVR